MSITHAQRRGSIYVFVLMATLFVVVAGVAAIATQRARLGEQRSIEQARLARAEVSSALEVGLSILADDPTGLTWRTDKQVEIDAPDLRGAGDARVLLTLTDPDDDDLTDDTRDPVLLSVRVQARDAVRMASATIEPVLEAFDCLDYAVVSGSLTQSMGATRAVSGAESTGALQLAKSPAPSKAVLAVSLGTLQASVGDASLVEIDTIGGEPALPSGALIDEYVARATPISHRATLGPGLLSPANNPWGTVNARGIYMMDCKNQRVALESLRVVGTLILLDVGPGSSIEAGVAMEPAFPDQPTLLVRGSLQHKGANDLLESKAGNVNPASAPYMGVADTDATDSFPSIIRGVTFIDGDLRVSETARFDGVLLVTGTLAIDRTLIATHRAPGAFIPGLCKATGMAIRPGSVQREIVP